MIPTKFQGKWPFDSGEEAKNRFSRWSPWPSWISYRKDFWSTSHSDASYQVSSQLAFRFRRRSKKTDFQDDRHCGHLGFPIRRILDFLIYKSPRCFLPSFESIGLSVQEKKRKLDFQDGQLGDELGFPIRTISAIFDLQVTRCFVSSFESMGILVTEKKRKTDFQDGGHLGFPIGMF